MSTKSITYAETRSIRVERKFIHKWIIQDFDCKNMRGALPSTKFNFTLGFSYNAELSIIGDNCQSRQCELVIKFAHTNIRLPWQLNVTLWLGEKKGEKAPSILSVDYDKTWIELSHYGPPGNSLCALPEYKYTIMCEIIFVDYEKETAIFPIPESKLRDNLVELFETKTFWDITLNVSGHDLHAHKGILASRSKVFAAMFEHDMEEAKSNTVSITDIDLEAAEEMLRYIYTDEVSNINEMAFKLFPASDKYDLPKLKSMCENELAKNISIENAANILNLADLHTSQELMDHAVGFIKNNNKAVSATEAWKELANKCPHLIAKICLQIIN